MPLLTALADAAASEVLAFADLFEQLDADARSAPTPCAAWSIDDLATHVAVGVFRDAEAFHRARVGSALPPGELDLGDVDPADVIRLGVSHLHAALDHPPDQSAEVPTPFGPYPAAEALLCLVIEFGVHHHDLQIATGATHSTLSTPTVDAIFDFGEMYLLMQSAPLEDDPVTFTLAAPSTTMSITWTGHHWERGASAPRECRIAGSDDAIARLMLRRLDVTDPRLNLLDPGRFAPLFPSAIRTL